MSHFTWSFLSQHHPAPQLTTERCSCYYPELKARYCRETHSKEWLQRHRVRFLAGFFFFLCKIFHFSMEQAAILMEAIKWTRRKQEKGILCHTYLELPRTEGKEGNPDIKSLLVAMLIWKWRHFPAEGYRINKECAGIVWEKPQEGEGCRINCSLLGSLFSAGWWSCGNKRGCFV